MLLKTKIIVSYCFISLSSFFEEDCYALRPRSKECVRVSSASSTMRGRIIDIYGEPLIGATIREESGANGTVTDVEGNSFLSAPDNAVLQISFIGYKSQGVSVKGRSMLEICSEENILLLDYMIVTVLGPGKKEFSLTYAVQKMRGEELNRVKEVNMITVLVGETAGVQVSKNSSGTDGSAKVSIRGVRSVVGDNQPLYVIDSAPTLNSTSEQSYSAIGGVTNAGDRDGGDGISDPNPEDVESISTLKGAPAAAPYGSQTINGVIPITIKKGNAVGWRDIHFSTGPTFEKVFSLSEMQNNYGVSDVTDSWGEKEGLTVCGNLGDSFRTGLTSTIPVSVNSGNDKLQTCFSYTSTTGCGILNENKLSKHNISLRETAVFSNSRLKLDGSVSVMKQTVKNKPVSGGSYMNPLVDLYRFLCDKDLSYHKENYECYNEDRELNIQNWYTLTGDFEQSPYWIQDHIRSKDTCIRLFLSLSANSEVTDWLTPQACGNLDHLAGRLRQRSYASAVTTPCGMDGRCIEMDYQETQMYGDVMAMVKKQLNDFTLDIAIGGSISGRITNFTRIDSKNASLRYVGVFNLANIVMSSSVNIDQKMDAHYQLQSVLAMAQISYKEEVFLDLIARNNWSSMLVYTKYEKKGFSYLSAGVFFLSDKRIKMPEWVSFLKFCGAHSITDNGMPPFITYPVSYVTADGEVLAGNAAPFVEVKPEMTHSVELGMEWKSLQHRLGLNLTCYRTGTYEQFFKLPVSTGDKYAYRYVNAGDIRNQGREITLDVTPVLTPDFARKTSLNFSANKNRIVELHEELEEFVYGPTNFPPSCVMKLVRGGSISNVCGKAFIRDKTGNTIYGADGDYKGFPLVEGDGSTVRVGNVNPNFMLRWNHPSSYKGFSLYFLSDWRYGDEVLSQTQAEMDLCGVSKATAQAYDKGYVPPEGRQVSDVKGFYKNVVGGRAGATEYYMYDATNSRLREVSLSYSFPRGWIQKMNCLKGLQLSFVTRNPCLLYKKASFDPDPVLSTGNGNQGVEVSGMPTTRSLDFTLTCGLQEQERRR